MHEPLLAATGAPAVLVREAGVLVLRVAEPLAAPPRLTHAADVLAVDGAASRWRIRGVAHPRPVLELHTANGRPLPLAEPRVALEGSQNFRDLGGYPAADSRRVRWNRLFRADALSTLTAADVAHLEAIGLRSVCDFRGADEVSEEPGAFADHPAIGYRNLAIGENASPAEWRARFESGDFGDLDEAFLARSYRAMLDTRADVFAAALRGFLAADALPAVFHCTAGKDRTGVMAALVLELLGVPRAHVVADYALTAHYTEGRIRAAERWFGERGIPLEVAERLFSARPPNIEAALEHLDEEHGGIARYARQRMGLGEDEIAALRERLLA